MLTKPVQCVLVGFFTAAGLLPICTCGAQTLRGQLLQIPPRAMGEAQALDETPVRNLVNASSLALEVPTLIAAIDHEPAFAPGMPARELAFLCLTSAGDRDGHITIADPVHLDRIILAAMEEPSETKKRAINALRLAAPSLVPRVNEVIPTLLNDPDPSVVYGVVGLIYARNIAPEPFVDSMRSVAEQPETIIPAAWQSIVANELEHAHAGTYQTRISPRLGVMIRETAVCIVIGKGAAIDDDVARVAASDEATRLAYALALCAFMNLPGGPVYTCTPETQLAIAVLVGAIAVEYDKQFVTGNERREGLTAFLQSAAVSPEAKHALAQSLIAVADKIEARPPLIGAPEAMASEAEYNTWLVGELRAQAALVP